MAKADHSTEVTIDSAATIPNRDSDESEVTARVRHSAPRIIFLNIGKNLKARVLTFQMSIAGRM